MSLNNSVTHLIIEKDGVSAETSAAGTAMSAALTEPGQVGVFDTNYNKVDRSDPPSEFVVARALDESGDGNVDSFKITPELQSKGINSYTYRSYNPAQEMQFLITDYLGKCEEEFFLKFRMRNQQIFRTQGYIDFNRFFSIRTDCCTQCGDGCPTGDANEVSLKMNERLNGDEDPYISSVIVARQDLTIMTHGTSTDYTAGDEMTEADVQALITYNKSEANSDNWVYTDLQVSISTLGIADFCGVNLRYFKPRIITVDPILDEGFDCNGSVEILQEASPEEGSWYDVKQKEYKDEENFLPYAGVYRSSESTGVGIDQEYYSEKGINYDTIVLRFLNRNMSGWQEFTSNIEVNLHLATDSNNVNTVLQDLDSIAEKAGFDALADDQAAAESDPTVAEETSSLDDEDVDGIG